LIVGVLPEEDEESERIFATLAGRNAINMFSPAWAVGVVTPELDSNGAQRQEVQALLDKLEVF
jgi:hypothetical protein